MVVVDFWEHYLLFQAHCVITVAVEASSGNSPKVTNAWQRDVDQTLKELVGASAAQGDFAADNNATKLEFHTGASEAASSKMSLSSGGNLTVTGNVSVGGDLDVTGSFDMSDANITNVGSIALDSISGDGDSNTSITFSGSDESLLRLVVQRPQHSIHHKHSL